MPRRASLVARPRVVLMVLACCMSAATATSSGRRLLSRQHRRERRNQRSEYGSLGQKALERYIEPTRRVGASVAAENKKIFAKQKTVKTISMLRKDQGNYDPYKEDLTACCQICPYKFHKDLMLLELGEELHQRTLDNFNEWHAEVSANGSVTPIMRTHRVAPPMPGDTDLGVLLDVTSDSSTRSPLSMQRQHSSRMVIRPSSSSNSIRDGREGGDGRPDPIARAMFGPIEVAAAQAHTFHFRSSGLQKSGAGAGAGGGAGAETETKPKKPPEPIWDKETKQWVCPRPGGKKNQKPPPVPQIQGVQDVCCP